MSDRGHAHGARPDAGSPDAESPDAVDLRMALLLSSRSTSAELRRQLQQEGTRESEELLGRLNALDFVGNLVGEAGDMPERLGEYRITGLLGRGGMGTVYLAWQEQLEREVALKVLSASWSADPTMRQRFRAEARATAALHHRHIVPIYDYGEAQGCMFFAMERVDGHSLDRHIAVARRMGRPPMEPLEAARRFAGVADALGLAHRRRILHRDVKPGNILVAGDGTLALTDFGLAKVLDQASVNLTSKNSGFLGTLHYSPPEQALNGQLSPASDLYSLGVTMFEALTGELPNAGRTTEAVLQSILHGTPRRLKDVLPRPPRDLSAVLEKLLSREPQDRYQDGEALSRDLLRIADGEPVHIRRQPLLLRLYRRARRNPVLAGAVVAAAVLLFVTFFLLRVLRIEKDTSLVSRHQTNLFAVVNQVRGDTGWPWGCEPLLESLCGWPAPPVEPNAAILAALRRAGEEVPDDPLVGRMRTAYVDDPLPEASALLRAGRGFEALALYDSAIASALEVRSLADLSAELRLYRLYLGRAAAHLTASVARPGDARRDLDLASFLRPRAEFPRGLARVLDVVESADVEAAVQRLEGDLAAARPQRRAVVGRLLWAAAGARPPAAAQLMPFPLSHRDRVHLQRLAAALVDVEPADVLAEREATGLAAQLRDIAREALARIGEPAALREVAARMAAAAARAVHPQSPLQGWLGVTQLLSNPLSSLPILDLQDEVMAPALQLAAWEALLSLRPQRATVEVLLPRFQQLAHDHPGLPGLLRQSARLHVAARADAARTLLSNWIAEAPDEPEALFARLALDLREVRLDAALDAAMAAVQCSFDRAAALRRVAALCQEAAGDARPGEREAMLALGATFRALPP